MRTKATPDGPIGSPIPHSLPVCVVRSERALAQDEEALAVFRPDELGRQLAGDRPPERLRGVRLDDLDAPVNGREGELVVHTGSPRGRGRAHAVPQLVVARSVARHDSQLSSVQVRDTESVRDQRAACTAPERETPSGSGPAHWDRSRPRGDSG